MTGRRSEKNGWSLFLLILTGIVLGSFIGSLTKDISWLNWLNFGKGFGLVNPLEMNLEIIQITFKLWINISIASILGVGLAIFVYRKI
ncbi:MAG: uncharacterized protein K0R15_516 [Clostridiales bacterium]|jgi:hypothetical protein|nr:uncharacterized protein [Clostridiales bacterium]